MPATALQEKVADPYVSGLLSGVKWSDAALSFAFPPDPAPFANYNSSEPTNNFSSLTSDEHAALRAALQEFASVSGLSFNETNDTSAPLRFAKSDATGTAWAYAPGSSDKSGDVWFGNSGDLIGAAQPGNYAWFTMLHEIGHALGLKHPHEVEGAFAAMPKDRDSVEYSVMSYRSFVGAKGMAYANDDDSYPQSLMMYDIAALQEMYGANYGFRGTDTTYAWNAKTGELTVNGIAEPKPLGNKVFLTVWDGGGTDTYSFASYKKTLKIDLAPGAWTVTAKAQLAELGNGTLARGNIANALLHDGNPASLIENATGGAGNDTISGNAAANVLTGGAGNDTINGRGGGDTAVFKGKASNFEVEKANDAWIVSDSRKGGGEGTDRLLNIEVLQFKDRTVSITTSKANPKAAARESKASETPQKAKVQADDTPDNGVAHPWGNALGEWAGRSHGHATDLHAASVATHLAFPDLHL